MRRIGLSIIAALLWGGDYCFSGQGGAGVVTYDSLFRDASAFSVTPSGNIYVLDRAANELLKVTPEGKIVARTGGIGWSETVFDEPSDVCSPSDIRTYVADYGNHRIVYFDGSLNVISSLKLHDGGSLSGQFGYPRSVALDRNGSLFLVDGENIRIVKFDRQNTILQTFGGVEAGQGKVSDPRRIRISEDDKLYVQDAKRILAYDIFGNYLFVEPLRPEFRLRAFTVFHNSVYLLDSAGVRGISQEIDTTIAFAAAASAIDIGVTEDKMYLLSKTGIIVLPLDAAWMRRPDR